MIFASSKRAWRTQHLVELYSCATWRSAKWARKPWVLHGCRFWQSAGSSSASLAARPHSQTFCAKLKKQLAPLADGQIGTLIEGCKQSPMPRRVPPESSGGKNKG